MHIVSSLDAQILELEEIIDNLVTTIPLYLNLETFWKLRTTTRVKMNSMSIRGQKRFIPIHCYQRRG